MFDRLLTGHQAQQSLHHNRNQGDLSRANLDIELGEGWHTPQPEERKIVSLNEMKNALRDHEQRRFLDSDEHAARRSPSALLLFYVFRYY